MRRTYSLVGSLPSAARPRCGESHRRCTRCRARKQRWPRFLERSWLSLVRPATVTVVQAYVDAARLGGRGTQCCGVTATGDGCTSSPVDSLSQVLPGKLPRGPLVKRDPACRTYRAIGGRSASISSSCRHPSSRSRSLGPSWATAQNLAARTGHAEPGPQCSRRPLDHRPPPATSPAAGQRRKLSQRAGIVNSPVLKRDLDRALREETPRWHG